MYRMCRRCTEGVQKECTEECTEGLNEKKAACALTGWLYGPQGMPRHRAQAARSLCLPPASPSPPPTHQPPPSTSPSQPPPSALALAAAATALALAVANHCRPWQLGLGPAPAAVGLALAAASPRFALAAVPLAAPLSTAAAA